MSKKFVVTETRVIGIFNDRDEAWDYLDKMQAESPDSKIQWHVEDKENAKIL